MNRCTISQDQSHYDLIIIGGGIAGGMLAAAMSRNGIKTLVLEGGTHPKFAIGESMILETSEIMRSMAVAFDVPELEVFSSEYFLSTAGTTHGVKRHFSFMPHEQDGTLEPTNVIQAVIPKRPYGHELHLYRQDTDYYYLAVARQYGATIMQNERVNDVTIDDHGVTVSTAKDRRFTSDYIVDAGGHGSLLAKDHNLRSTDGLQTHTRSIFTHMVGVESFHKNGPDIKQLDIPFSLSEGTHHHVFEGGWMWVIPFNNHKDATNQLCSVGLLLDPRIHPVREDMTPEEEFNDFVGRYPAMQTHLDGAKAVRDWVRTGRIQYTAKQCVGDRFCLLGHAAGFIDPLFSKGLYSSLASIFTFGREFLLAHSDKNDNKKYSRERFLPVERLTLDYIKSNDRLVSNAIKSFAHGALWRQYSVLWLTGAYLELIKLTTFRQDLLKNTNSNKQRWAYPMPPLNLIGGAFEPYAKLFDQVSSQIENLDMTNESAIAQCVEDIRTQILASEWIPQSHRKIAAGATHLPRNKYNLKLFTRKGGLLGEKPYRDHFFGNTNPIGLALFLAKDATHYSRLNIKSRHKRKLRSAL